MRPSGSPGLDALAFAACRSFSCAMKMNARLISLVRLRRYRVVASVELRFPVALKY